MYYTLHSLACTQNDRRPGESFPPSPLFPPGVCIGHGPFVVKDTAKHHVYVTVCTVVACKANASEHFYRI